MIVEMDLIVVMLKFISTMVFMIVGLNKVLILMVKQQMMHQDGQYH